MTTAPSPDHATTRRRTRAAVATLAATLGVVTLVAPVVAAGPDEVEHAPTPAAPAVGTTPAPTTTVPTAGPPTTPPPSATPTITAPPATPPATLPTTPSTTAPPTTPTTAPTTTVAPTPPAPAALNVRVSPEMVPHILASIRYLESRGDYLAPPNRGNASGAYQFIARTWGNYGGYPHAYLAPPEVQDERAEIDVRKFLHAWNNDVSMIPILWYYPKAARDPWLMDVVPVPSAGNVLTIREYQTRWMGYYSFFSGQPLPPKLTEAERNARAGLPPELPGPDEQPVAMAYPVLGPSRVAVPACDADDPPGDGRDPGLFASAGLCDEHAPGIVFGVKLQPVLAVADGVVTAVHDDPGSDQPITVVVTDPTGRSYVHSGFNDDNPGTDDGAAPRHLRLGALARVGNIVHAGQVLGFMGNSAALPLGIRAEVPTDATVSIDPNTTAPHIRISIVEVDGTPVDAFGPLIDALFRQNCTVATGPWSMPPNGGGHTPVTIETTDNDRTIDSEWVIDERAVVTATGWAAMINPHDDCAYAPREPHGPGAGGSNDVPLRWLLPIDVPTSIWVQLAADQVGVRAPVPLRRG